MVFPIYRLLSLVTGIPVPPSYSISHMEPSYDYLFKVLIIGNSGVGKTALLLRYTDGVFNPEFHTTIGVDFKISTVDIDGKLVKMQLWDTAGQDRFRNIVASYYRGAHGVIMVYDVTDTESFTSIRAWHDETKVHLQANVPKLLVGNKVDEAGRTVTSDEGQQLAEQLGMEWMETSAKSEFHVKEAFEALARTILSRAGLLNLQPAKSIAQLPSTKPVSRGICCST